MAIIPITPALLAFGRRKATWSAIIAGTLVATACWWWLPSTPRSRLALPPDVYGDLVFSPDFRYGVIVHGEPREAALWDLFGSRRLFSFRVASVKLDNEFAHLFVISPDNQLLVALAKGKATYRKIPSGEFWQPDTRTDFPSDFPHGKWSELTSDARGRLLIVERSVFDPTAIRDLLSGKELGNVPAANAILARSPGGFLQYLDWKDRGEVRELPGGALVGILAGDEIRQEVILGDEGVAGPLNPSIVLLAPDCKTVAFVKCGAIELWDVPTNSKRLLDMTADSVRPLGYVEYGPPFAAISVDGGFVATMARRQKRFHPWIGWLLDYLGWGALQNELVLFELNLGTEIASFGTANRAYFSLDGKSLAIAGDALDIYDFPLRRPWLKVAGIAFATAAGLWFLGWSLGRRKTKTQKKHKCSFMFSFFVPTPKKE